MSVQTAQESQPQDWVAEDTIDLRPYLNIFLNWWREILVITTSAVIVAIFAILTIRFVLPLQYIASANVAIVRTTSDVTFAERFRTAEADLGADVGGLSARRSALLGLVTTGTVAQQVINDLDNVLTAREQIPSNLLQMVDAETVTQAGSRADSDLIRIIVNADDPDKAATIANSWAKAYVHEVNTIYSQVPDEVLASIQAELTEAEEEYQAAQAALETFVANNQIEELNAVITVLKQQVAQEVSLQQSVLAQWQRAQEQLNTAQALHAQIEAGEAGAVRTNVAALQILKLSVYGMAPSQLQVEMRDFPEISKEEMLADVVGLITSLETQIQDLETQVVTNSEQLREIGDDSRLPQAVLRDLRTTQAQLEAEQAQQRQLDQQRDLSWETYRTLRSKVAELNLTRAAATSEVRLGSEAVAPVNPTRRVSLITSVFLAGVIGFVISIFIVLLSTYLGISPLLAKATKSDT